jgi:pyruvate dehydrogenase E2 component (dihydrolipoamide acetyltransferase)
MSSETIYIPDIGASEEVEVIEVSVEVGEEVTQDQTMIVLESDKTTMDIPSPRAGQIKELLLNVGDKVATGSPMMKLLQDSLSTDQSHSMLEVSQDSGAANRVEGENFAQQALLVAEKACAQLSEQQDQTVLMPDLGTDGSVLVIEVSVKVGDALTKDETMLVLESDKSTMEIPAQYSGTLKRLDINEGDEVKTGAVIGVIESTFDQAMDAHVSSHDTKPVHDQSTAAESSLTPLSMKNPEPSELAVARQNPATPSVNDANENTETTVYAGPAVRRLAREIGVSLQAIKGTSSKGRISKDDIKAYVKEILNTPATAMVEADKMPVIDFSQFGPIEKQPLNRIKQATARNMSRSWRHIPMVTQFDETDITDLEHYWREVLPKQIDSKVTMLAFVVKAVAKALEKFPQFNSSIDPDGKILIIKKFINIGIAVETPQGLMVPVIKNVNHKTVVDIAQEAAHLAKAAREKKLPLDAMQGGCFSISSLGGIGGTQFTPIVNAPEVAILGLSRSSMKPVYDYNSQTFLPRLMLPLSLTYDHRVVDGAEAARFTVYISNLLNDIRHLLL